MIAMMSHHPSVILAKARIQRGRVGFPPFMGKCPKDKGGAKHEAYNCPLWLRHFPRRAGETLPCRFPSTRE